MQTLFKSAILLLFAVFVLTTRGAEETAVVNESKINVRGQPALIGEVVTQLQRGEKVTVLEFVTNERSKPGEPTNWAKIRLPANTPVWIFGDMVKNGAVAVNRLNMRAGPGENYSVIGRLDRGEKVKVIRSMGDWTEIEAPPTAYAFVDSRLLKISESTASSPAASAPTVAAAAPPQVSTPSGVNVESAPESPTSQTNQTVAVQTPDANPLRDALAPATQPQAPEEPPPISTPEPAAPITLPETAQTAPPVISETAPISQPAVAPTSSQPLSPSLAETTAGPQTKTEENVAAFTPPRQRRIVRREGIIKPTVSIQAPTWYELIHPQTKRTIDYLHAEKAGVKLKELKGQKVIVTGEELVDPRWPNTPILEIETLDIAP